VATFSQLRDFLFRLRYGFRGVPVSCGDQVIRLDESLRRWDCQSEAQVQDVMRDLLRPGDCVVDVGANFGYHTLFCASCVGPSGHVYALEPVPSNYRLLKRHIALNNFDRQITLIPKAASDLPGGTLELHGVQNGVSLVAGMHKDDADGITLSVPVTTLDECLAHRSKPVNLIKIDVEGAEYLVLRGAVKLLAQDRPLLIIEVHSFALPSFGISVEAFRKELETLGYIERVIDTVAGAEGNYYHALYSPVEEERAS
jgi:FkbM family methyltransferase